MSKNPIGATGNFGNLAGDYERGRRDYPQELLNRVLRHVGNAAQSLFLDVGCGTGKATRLIASAGRLVIGVDPDPKCIQTAWEQGGSNLAYRLAKAEDLPFRDETFDAVTTFSSFHWWCHNPGAISSIRRVLRAEGSFLVVNKYDAGPFREEARAIIAHYSPYALTDAKQGYHPQKLLEADGHWKVTGEELRYEEHFTLPELIWQIRSLSAWNCVPEARSAETTAALEAHFASQLENGLYRRPLRMAIVIARKPK